MKNIDRLVRHIIKNGAKNIMIHTIPETNNWITCYKIDKNKWMLTLSAPMGNVTYNLGTVTNKQHLQLWLELIRTEIERKTSQFLLAKELKNRIYQFKKNYNNNYENTIKKATQKKTKQKRIKPGKRTKRSKKSTC